MKIDFRITRLEYYNARKRIQMIIFGILDHKKPWNLDLEKITKDIAHHLFTLFRSEITLTSINLEPERAVFMFELDIDYPSLKIKKEK